jgi:HlyD family secretion protein
MAGRSRLLTIGLPLLAVLGIGYGAHVVLSGEPDRPKVEAAEAPPRNPAADPASAKAGKAMLGAVGLIEASSENVAIGAHLPGVVALVAVRPGDRVSKGDVLFALDDRAGVADLAAREAQLGVAKAAVRTAEVEAAERSTNLKLAQSVDDPRAISRQELEARRFALEAAQARLAEAKARVKDAEAAVSASRTTLAQLVVRAPLPAQVLQVNIRAGEYAATGALATPLMVLGQTDELHVRVDIDEADIPRFSPGQPATLTLRGAADQRIAARFVRVEPFVTPKTALSGAIAERVDTRVLRVIYAFAPQGLPAFAGQQVDVFLPARLQPGAPPKGSGA